MEITKKITIEQLEKISNQQKELNTLLTNIGLLDVEEFKNTLQQEYGNINIDLTDGSYAEVEETVE